MKFTLPRPPMNFKLRFREKKKSNFIKFQASTKFGEKIEYFSSSVVNTS